ncbi:hypothetical protein BDZ91DRAFT_300742 [Kalaharituber pfeilii]|nr:hypothetical protein BDZ91DRAFT_300742 [Kalaharituber pfeilii]
MNSRNVACGIFGCRHMGTVTLFSGLAVKLTLGRFFFFFFLPLISFPLILLPYVFQYLVFPYLQFLLFCFMLGFYFAVYDWFWCLSGCVISITDGFGAIAFLPLLFFHYILCIRRRNFQRVSLVAPSVDLRPPHRKCNNPPHHVIIVNLARRLESGERRF